MARMAEADYSYFLLTVTLTTGVIKYHGKVILARERMQVCSGVASLALMLGHRSFCNTPCLTISIV